MKIPENVSDTGTYTEKCPKCGQLAIPRGSFLFSIIPIPLNVKIWFTRINIEILATLRYCPQCGFLQLKARQEM